jgi:peptidyl-prolyl cis-trans isomerase C
MTVESRWGHHVVCVDAIERGELLSFDQALPKIAAYLETQARQNAIHQYLQILAERYGVRGLDAVAAD